MKYLIILTLFLTGCQTASTAIDKAQDAKAESDEIRTKATVRSLCSLSFDSVVNHFGTDQALWEAYVSICAPRHSLK